MSVITVILLLGVLVECREFLQINKCSDRSMEVKLSALLENYDRLTEQPTDQSTEDGQNGSWESFTSNNFCPSFIQRSGTVKCNVNIAEKTNIRCIKCLNKYKHMSAITT